MRNEPFLKDVGMKIRQARKEKNISLRQLTVLTGMYKASLSEIENGLRDSHILTLKHIADCIGVDLKEFL